MKFFIVKVIKEKKIKFKFKFIIWKKKKKKKVCNRIGKVISSTLIFF